LDYLASEFFHWEAQFVPLLFTVFVQVAYHDVVFHVSGSLHNVFLEVALLCNFHNVSYSLFYVLSCYGNL
jgi:hypothetical protein